MEIHKHYVLDEEQRAVAVQVPIREFEKIEEVLENYGLSQMMDEVAGDERLSGETAKEYYQSLKNELAG